MAENMVRCPRCHEVFDAEAGPCTKCGAPYEAPVAAPLPADGLYVDRYAGTPFVPAPETALLPARRRSNSTGLLIGGGAVLIVAAIMVAIVAVTLGLGSGQTAAPVYVVPKTDQPSPTPTLPPSIALTLQQLDDPNLSADVVVETAVDVNDPSLGKHERQSVSFKGQIAGGNEAGIVTQAGITREYRVVDNVVFVRVPPATRWSIAASIPTYLVIDQSFRITTPQMLRFVAAETLDGQAVNHFQTTRMWVPDVARIAMINTSDFAFKPETVVLDLWTTPDGEPVKAVFSATNLAANGTKLLDIETTYTFDNVGVPQTIEVPGPSPSGSAGAKPST